MRCGRRSIAGWAMRAAAGPEPLKTLPGALRPCRAWRGGIELDRNHLIVIGHSEGGNLALWLAAQKQAVCARGNYTGGYLRSPCL